MKEAEDIKLIIDNLPKEQLRKRSRGITTSSFKLGYKRDESLDIGRIEGKIDDQRNGGRFDEKNKRLSHRFRYNRCLCYNNRLNVLKSLSSPVIEEALFLDKLDKSPKYHNRVTDSERNGIERVNKAIRDYLEEVAGEAEEEIRQRQEQIA